MAELHADPELERAFGSAARDHYRWQTRGAGVAARERHLCEQAFRPLGRRVLDLGCGAGATLYHLDAPPGAVGVDLFPERLDFARRELPGCIFVQASAYDLPFEAGQFDQVIVRDVVHHLAEPARMVAEVHRVLAPGGRIDLLEPCRYSPLIALHALTHRVERGELRSTPARLRRLLGGRFEVAHVRHLQPLPIHRLVYHPRLGRPELARSRLVRPLVDALESAAGVLVPRWAHAYLHLRGVRR